MANKLKTDVQINGKGADVDLELTPEQASRLLERLAAGEVAYVNLVTPGTKYGTVRNLPVDTPEAYAQ